MKYIRTKDSVYEVKKDDITFLNRPSYECICDGGVVGAIVAKSAVIKEADTIEELCDGYVVKVGDVYIVWQILTFDQIKLNYKREGYEVYGAIWTDKGLIYVAKMNDKGELELI